MGNPAGVRRDFVALEARRMEAARLLRAGLSQAEVARKIGAHRQSVSRWARELEASGLRGLRKAERTGRPPKLSAAQLRDIERALKRGPESFGFSSGLWTAGRVRELIEQRSGVRYHADHVWRILHKLNWSCQRPSGRALERDERAIGRWKKYRWLQIKKKRSARGEPLSSSTRAD
jgi:transposase